MSSTPADTIYHAQEVSEHEEQERHEQEQEAEPSITITVSHRGKPYPLTLPHTTTLYTLQTQLEELTSVPPELQKLLVKGKKLGANAGKGESNPEDVSLRDAGLKDGAKVQMLGSSREEVGGMRGVEEERKRRERIMRERAMKPQAKLRSTGSSSTSAPNLKYRFHTLTPLPHLPNPGAAHALLTRLSEDPAIRHVMQVHEFSVGVLTELAPHEHPELLGLNVNAGEAIKLRLRTNAYDGFRSYREVRKVLCHELTHNVWGDHDENFKTLNSKLNREVAEFERAQADGTHRLNGSGDVYEPVDEAEVQSFVLGGTASVGRAGADESREERRRRILEAALGRQRKEEEEIEQSCGTGSGAEVAKRV